MSTEKVKGIHVWGPAIIDFDNLEKIGISLFCIMNNWDSNDSEYYLYWLDNGKKRHEKHDCPPDYKIIVSKLPDELKKFLKWFYEFKLRWGV